MSMTASFPGVEFNGNVTGYRVSACFTHNAGFAGYFYVYVQVRADAAAQSVPTADLGDEIGNTPTGVLRLTGNKITHTFPGIQLISATDAATHNEKRRVLEFKYTDETTASWKPDHPRRTDPPKFSTTSERGIQNRRLGDLYSMNFGQQPEHVLAFAVRRASSGVQAIRFTKMANKFGCWLTKFVEYHRAADPSFNVTFAEKRVTVNGRTLSRAYVDETYGDLLRWPQVPLAQVAANGEQSTDLAKQTVPEFTQRELVRHGIEQFEPDAIGEVVQTATLVLNDDQNITPRLRALRVG